MTTASRFDVLMQEAKQPPYITFELDEPALVIPLSPAVPYKQPGRDITRYRYRVAVAASSGALELRMMTLPETASAHFTKAAEHGGFVSVTMQETANGMRYWSKPLTEPLTEVEQRFVSEHRQADASTQ